MSDGERTDGGDEPDAGEAAAAETDEAVVAELDEATATGGDIPEDVPVWDDEYVDRVSDRLMHNFDLERDRSVRGETFTLYGRMDVTSQKHFLHPSLNYANHGATEHLFVARRDGATVADVERYVELGHELADEWIEADEEHYSTDFTFALVVPRVRDDVREFVSGFEDRSLIRYGYYGHYEVNLVAVAPENESVVASRATDLDSAFALWESPGEESSGEESSGLLDRLF